MVRSTAAAANLLSGCFGIKPVEHDQYVIEDPVLTVSHNFTYYAPEEMMAVPLNRPIIVTFGSKASPQAQTQLPRVHLIFPDQVQDRLENDLECTTQKQVNVGEIHGAILYRDSTLIYKHLCEQPTLIAERIFGSRIVTQPNTVVPIRRGQTIGFGVSTDAFGGPLWWYYFRIASLSQLKQQVAARRM